MTASNTDTWDEALAVFKEGKYPVTIDLCERILRTQVEDAAAWHLKGVSAHQLGRTDDALEAIQQAIFLNADRAEFRNSLGVVFLGQSKLAEAEKAFRQAVGLKPGYVEGWCNLGQCLELSDMQAAEHTYVQGIKKTQDAELTVRLARLLEDQGDSERAIKLYHDALQQRPHDPLAFLRLALLVEQENPLDAISLCRRSLALDPQQEPVQICIGRVLTRLSNRGSSLPLPLVRQMQREAIYHLENAAVISHLQARSPNAGKIHFFREAKHRCK